MDGDGRGDLVTGCFEGGSYLLRGKDGGGFLAPEPVLDEEGTRLRVGMFWDYEKKAWAEDGKDLGISATPVDWDADGDLDLLLGTQSGHVYLSENAGSPKQPVYKKVGAPLQAAGQKLEVPGHHAMPVVADWDGDGLWDLVSGSGAGGAVWFRNQGKKGEPRFAAAEQLVPPANGDWESPGQRTQAAVADFDADGRLDLLLGDYRSRTSKDKKTTREYCGWVWFYRRTSEAKQADRER
jgi:hypothetical protein